RVRPGLRGARGKPEIAGVADHLARGAAGRVHHADDAVVPAGRAGQGVPHRRPRQGPEGPVGRARTRVPELADPGHHGRWHPDRVHARRDGHRGAGVRDPWHRAAGARRREPARLSARAGHGPFHRRRLRVDEPPDGHHLQRGRPADPREGRGVSMATATTAALAAPKRRGSFYRTFAKRNIIATVALIVLAVVIIAAIAAPLIAPGDPVDMSPADRLKSPGDYGWLGTDVFGRDILSRILYGTRISLGVGVVSVLVAA